MDKASRQEGLVAKFQVAELGCTNDQWWQAKRNGRWIDLSSRVIAACAAPDGEARRALAAVLDAGPGSMLHAGSALAWLGFRGYTLSRPCVARVRGAATWEPELARLHRLRDVRPNDLVVVRGVPTESALRAIWCEAARYANPALVDIGVRKIGRLVDEAHRLGLATWAGLHELVDDIHQRGRSGTVIMRALAEGRPPGTSATESRNEDRLEDLLDEAGVRPLRRQPVLGGHEPIGRCDHRDEELPLAVETNSRQHHTTPTDRAADELRYERLMDAGFTLGVIWEDDLWKNPGGVVETVALARRHARAGLRVVVHSPGCPWPHPRLGDPSRTFLAA